MLLMPCFEAMLREFNVRDTQKKVQSLDFLSECLKGTIISLLWVNPGEKIPAALMAVTTGAGAASYFLPSMKPSASLKTLHTATTGIVTEAMDSGVVVSFIKILFSELVPRSLTPGVYAALGISILTDMFVLKPLTRREGYKVYEALRIIRNALLTLGFASSVERILDKAIEVLFDAKLPVAASIIGVAALVLVEVTGDVLAEEKTSPKLLAAMRSIIISYSLLQSWYQAFLSIDAEDSPAAFAVALGMTAMLASMTAWYSNPEKTKAEEEGQAWVAEPMNRVAQKIEDSCGQRSSYTPLP